MLWENASSGELSCLVTSFVKLASCTYYRACLYHVLPVSQFEIVGFICGSDFWQAISTDR